LGMDSTRFSKTTLAAMVALFALVALALLVPRGGQHMPEQSWSAPSGGEAQPGFKTFSSLEELMSYLNRVSSAAYQRYYYGGVSVLKASPAEQGPAYVVGTNVQVEGVDEVDYVKIQGGLLAVARGREVALLRVYPPESASVASLIELPEDSHVVGVFLVSGSRLAVVALAEVEREVTPQATDGGDAKPVTILEAETRVYIYDISDPSAPTLLGNHSATGFPIAARLIGEQVYVVCQRAVYRILYTLFGAQREELPLIDGAPPSPSKAYYAPGEDYSVPVVVMRVDAASASMDYSVVFAPHVERVYASGASLYVFSTSYEWPTSLYQRLAELARPYLPAAYRDAIKAVIEMSGISEELKSQMLADILREALSLMDERDARRALAEIEEGLRGESLYIGPMTHVLKVDLSSLKPTARNKLWGALLDQFAVHETPEGNLVLALTAEKVAGLEASNSPGGGLYVYPMSQTVNAVVVADGSLNEISRLEGLAPGERIYSSRFVNSTLYLVTYRQVDPLFAIDLSDPRAPKVLGYLKVAGFSEYLHPLSESLLLGVGYGDDWSVKVSLFDVSNPSEPKELDSLSVGSYSPVLHDHKAFNYDRRAGIAALPVEGKGEAFSGLLLIKVEDGRIRVVDRYEHWGCDRAFFVDGYVVSVSRYSVRIWLGHSLVGEVSLGG